MANDAMIQVRIDTKTKTKAAKFFKRFGLSTSDGVRLLIAQALRAKDLAYITPKRVRPWKMSMPDAPRRFLWKNSKT